VEHREELIPPLQTKMLEQTKQAWIDRLEEVGVPAGPINTVAEVFDEPQLAAREMRVQVPHPLNPELELVGSPIKLSRTPVDDRRPPPMLGEHTEQVLAKLGLV